MVGVRPEAVPEAPSSRRGGACPRPGTTEVARRKPGELSDIPCLCRRYVVDNYHRQKKAAKKESRLDMAKACEICGKIPTFGHNVSHAHNLTKRRWNPNLQTVRALVNGTPKRIKVCTSCLKAGKVIKAPRAKKGKPGAA